MGELDAVQSAGGGMPLDQLDEYLRKMGVDPSRMAGLPPVSLLGGPQGQQTASQGAQIPANLTRQPATPPVSLAGVPASSPSAPVNAASQPKLPVTRLTAPEVAPDLGTSSGTALTAGGTPPVSLTGAAGRPSASEVLQNLQAPKREDFPEQKLPMWRKVLGLSLAALSGKNAEPLAEQILHGRKEQADEKFVKATKDFNAQKQDIVQNVGVQDTESQIRERNAQAAEAERKANAPAAVPKEPKPEDVVHAYSQALASGDTAEAARLKPLVQEYMNTTKPPAGEKTGSEKPEIEAQIGPKPTKAQYGGKPYPSVAAAQAAWGKAYEQGLNREETNRKQPPAVNTSDPESQAMIKDIGSGRMPTARLDYIAARKPEILEAVAKAYPDFDGSKIQAYVEASKKFTSGKIATSLNSAGTMFDHAKRLYDHTTTASLVPGTEDYRIRQADVQHLAMEAATFLNNGNQPGQQEVQHYTELLSPKLPFNRKASIKEVVELLREKYGEYKQEWENAAPSDAYRRPMPGVSPNAEKAMAYVLNDGKGSAGAQAGAGAGGGAMPPGWH